MYILIVGIIMNITLNVLFVKSIGIVGAAIATTIATCILMIVILYCVIRNTRISIPWKNILMIIISNIILTIACIIIPKTIIGSIIGCVVGCVIYVLSLILLRALSKRDIDFFTTYLYKIKFIKPYIEKIVKFIEKHDLIYK